MLIFPLYSLLFMKILGRSLFLFLESKIVGLVLLVCSDLSDIIYCVTDFFFYFLLATRNVESNLWPTHSMNIGYISPNVFCLLSVCKPLVFFRACFVRHYSWLEQSLVRSKWYHWYWLKKKKTNWLWREQLETAEQEWGRWASMGRNNGQGLSTWSNRLPAFHLGSQSF